MPGPASHRPRSPGRRRGRPGRGRSRSAGRGSPAGLGRDVGLGGDVALSGVDFVDGADDGPGGGVAEADGGAGRDGLPHGLRAHEGDPGDDHRIDRHAGLVFAAGLARHGGVGGDLHRLPRGGRSGSGLSLGRSEHSQEHSQEHGEAGRCQAGEPAPGDAATRDGDHCRPFHSNQGARTPPCRWPIQLWSSLRSCRSTPAGLSRPPGPAWRSPPFRMTGGRGADRQGASRAPGTGRPAARVGVRIAVRRTGCSTPPAGRRPPGGLAPWQ